jgi:multidrug resistance efflux pump
MLEMMLCSLITILPDYLYRRYAQGKRFGHEINLYTVWFELRWGITGCLILTISLITAVFYNHPATTNVTLFFRTVPILTETTGRVAEIYVGFSGPISKGAPIFKVDSSKQDAAVETARRKITEVAAALAVAKADVERTDGQLRQARGALQQAQDELETKEELHRRNPGIVPLRDIEKLRVAVEANEGGVAAATAAKQAADFKVSQVLPAEKSSAEAALDQAQVEVDKTTVRAGVSGRLEQFTLRVGDIITPIMRPAGVLIPDSLGQRSLQAGFNQIEAQIVKEGMAAEVTCVSKPFTVIPMVVTNVQDYIAAGQFRGGEQLIDPQQVKQPGTLLAFLEPLYKDGLDGVTPGSSCIANAYSSNHEAINAPGTSKMKGITLHVVDALALVHALILRLQTLVLPFKTLVLGGH